MCGCKNTTKHSCNSCQPTPCTPQPICDCPGGFMSSDCVNNVKTDFKCLNIETGLSLTQTLEQMDAQICAKIDSANNLLTLKNVGTGEVIFKGTNILGEKELKTLKKTGTLLDIISLPSDTEINFSINETALATFINTLTVNQSVGTGAEIFKDTVNGLSSFREITLTDNVEISPNVSINQAKLIKSIAVQGDNIEVKQKLITSDTLVLEEENGILKINLPQDNSIKTFYVNSNFSGTSNGSLTKPYKKYTEALNAVIGTGTPFIPQFINAKIILQSNVAVTQADLNLFPILQNKLSVNYAETLSDFGKREITFQGTTDYPFDTEFLINGVGFDVDLKLKNTVSQKLTNISIVCQNAFGVVKHVGYYNGVLYENQNYSEFIADNVNFICSYTPTSSYIILKDSTGNNITSFGNVVKGQNNIANTTPTVYIKNKNMNNNSLFNNTNIFIQSTSQTALKIENTQVQNSDKIQITRDKININVQAQVTNGIYLPKTDINLIEIVNSDFVRLVNLFEQSQFPYNATDTVQVGGDNSHIKLINSNLILENYYNYGSHNCNYFVEMDGTSNFSNTTAEVQNVPIQISHLQNIGAFGVPKNINFEASNGNKFNNPNFKLIATSAKVNSFDYSSSQSFTDDAEAVTNGLIVGNIYYNTTDKLMKRIV